MSILLMGSLDFPGEDKKFSLLARKLSGEATMAELDALETDLNKDPGFRLQAELFMQMWNEHSSAYHSAEAEQAFIRHFIHHKDEFLEEGKHVAPYFSGVDINKKPFRESKLKSGWLMLSLFGFFATIMLAGIFLWPKAQEPPVSSTQQMSTVITPNANRSSITLPDGSRVWLNAGSKLEYDQAHFNAKNREVSLSGEAYFDVTKDSTKPFLVQTANMQIRVLGTVFNVKAYPGDASAEASLIRGSVEVTLKNRPMERYVLKSSEKIIVRGDSLQNVLNRPSGLNDSLGETAIVTLRKLWKDQKKNGEIPETAWVENKLVFHSESFLDLSKKMERWYDVNIQFKSKIPEGILLTGSFTTETIREALDALKITTAFHYEINGKNIIIRN